MVGLIADSYDRNLQRVHGRLVDLGCGEVPLYEAYRDRVDEIVCVDWAGTIHGKQYLDAECDLNESLPFTAERFDTVILSDVLEHLPDPSRLWAEMARILAPGGSLLLNVPFFYWLHEVPYDYHRYTEFALRRAATAHGFEIDVLEPFGGSLEVFVDFVSKHLQVIPLIGKPSAVLVQWAALGFSRTVLGRRLVAATGKRFPLGYFLAARKTPE